MTPGKDTCQRQLWKGNQLLKDGVRGVAHTQRVRERHCMSVEGYQQNASHFCPLGPGFLHKIGLLEKRKAVCLALSKLISDPMPSRSAASSGAKLGLEGDAAFISHIPHPWGNPPPSAGMGTTQPPPSHQRRDLRLLSKGWPRARGSALWESSLSPCLVDTHFPDKGTEAQKVR